MVTPSQLIWNVILKIFLFARCAQSKIFAILMQYFGCMWLSIYIKAMKIADTTLTSRSRGLMKTEPLAPLWCKLVLRAYQFEVSEPVTAYPHSSQNQDLLTLLLFMAKRTIICKHTGVTWALHMTINIQGSPKSTIFYTETTWKLEQLEHLHSKLSCAWGIITTPWI